MLIWLSCHCARAEFVVGLQGNFKGTIANILRTCEKLQTPRLDAKAPPKSCTLCSRSVPQRLRMCSCPQAA